MSEPRILVLAGSARKNSLNSVLARAVEQILITRGVEVTLLEAGEVDLPLYHGDEEEEQGLPPDAVRIKRLFREHKGLVFCSPEYNSSVTPFLKNLIDWVSRPEEGQEPMAEFTGKIAALLAASPGRLGAMRSLVHLRDILGNIGVLVIPDERGIGSAHKAFDENGQWVDERARDGVTRVVESLVGVVKKLS
ncbi:MAG: NAD(P)H-dependent oxidoreductase [Verrucomicrobiota bacterium]